MSRIAIIGGHGKIALYLSEILIGRGHRVGSFIRNPDHAEDVSATGAEPVLADVENLLTWQLADLLEGYDAVIWSAGAGGGNPERTFAVDRDAAIRSMDAAERAGVARYVMVSYQGSSLEHSIPVDDSFHAYAQAKAEADDYLRRSNLAWTILGPSRLIDEPATGTISITRESGSVRRENVALVAAEVLNVPGTEGRTLPFNDGDTPIINALQVFN
ncbi:SDR family oxidoreductase [Mycetocola spongiae]|uniref:SDR family oxidoreductase n=1 Tax=Mycetocola spongiae TaxID=2859226 RepID=UPI001CF393D4|nr:SDR family oxidoreductase [Mycetocola spongiae]UCR87978.1 SDR family oxidoreductase [Mycetocola spongiae]